MWEDDHIWLPLVIEGRPFTARWIFDDDTMLDYELEMLDAPAVAAATSRV